MSVLPITRADLKRLCAIDAADTSSDAGLDALQAAEQPVWEYGLDPAVLAAPFNAGLLATLALGVAECLAGSFLRQSARATGATDDFHLGPLTVTASRTDSLAQLGERLAALGEKRLEPFARASKRLAFDAAGGAADGSGKTPLLAQTSVTGSVFDRPCGDFSDGEFSEGDAGGEEARP